MSPHDFFWNFGVRLFWPPTLMRYTWDMIYVNALGHGEHPYELPEGTARRKAARFYIRTSTILGMAYLLVMLTILGTLEYVGPRWSPAVAGVALWLATCVVIWRLPPKMFLHSKLRPPYSPKVTGALRLGHLTAVEVAIASVSIVSGVHWAIYFFLVAVGRAAFHNVPLSHVVAGSSSTRQCRRRTADE